MERTDDLLLGRDRAVSLQIAAVAVALACLVAASAYTRLDRLWPIAPAASGALATAVLAGTGAYYNEGLVPSLSLAGAAGAGGAAGLALRGTGDASPLAVVAGALLSGAVGATLGIALARVRDRGRGERARPSPAVLPGLLLGRDRGTSMRYLLWAAFEFAAIVGLLLAVRAGLVPGFPLQGAVSLWAALTLMVVPGAYHARHNDGLLVCVAFGAVPPLAVQGFVLYFELVYPYPPEGLLYGVGTALFFGAPAGTVAFLAGAGGRRALGSVRGSPGR